MAKLVKGDKFPNFAVDTVYVQDTTMEKLVDNKPTMVVVLRYIGCTVCRYDVHMIMTRYQEFVDKGVNVMVVMQSTVENAQADLTATNATLPFALVCDPEQKIYKELEILPADTMEALLGGEMEKLQVKGAAATAAGFEHGVYEGNEQQLPAFFYLDGDMTVLEAHYAKNIMDMPTVDDMLAKVK